MNLESQIFQSNFLNETQAEAIKGQNESYEEEEEKQELVFCLAYISGQNLKNISTSKCFVSIQESLNQLKAYQKFKTVKCISIITKKEETDQTQFKLETIEHVQQRIEEVKKSIQFDYLSIPSHLKDEKNRAIDQEFEIGQESDGKNDSEITKDQSFLRNFLIHENDDVKLKEEMEKFSNIEIFCQSVLNQSQPKNYTQSNNDSKEQAKINDWNIILCGTEQELKDLHRADERGEISNKDGFKVQLKEKGQCYFFLKTIHRNQGGLKYCNEELQKQAEDQLNYESFEIQKFQIGLFDHHNNAIYFNGLFCFKQNQEDISIMRIYLQNGASESRNKSQSVSIVLEYSNYQLKVEFPYLYCNSIKTLQQREKNYYYFQLVVPPKYFVRENSANLQQNLDQKKNAWIRVDNFFALDMKNELLRIEFVNNTVIQIYVDSTQNTMFESLIQKQFSKEVFCPQKDNDQISNMSNQFPKAEGNNLDRQWKRLLSYGFNLSYSILTLISHNKLSVIILNQFLNFIDDQKNNQKSEYILEKAIEYYYNQKKQINRLDFSSFKIIFQDIQKQENYLRIQEKRAKRDVKIVATRRVSITPSGLIYNLKELELSNRVLRIFQDHTDQFIRATFQDDSLENAKHMKYVSRYFRKQLESFTILSQQFINFGWSASQLRNSSSWFFHETEDLKKADVIIRIGDFSGIKPAAKKSARIGQCFSSSTPYILKQTPNIEFIDDISTPSVVIEQDKDGNLQYFEKKQKVFTDGIGTISQDLIREISDHLNAFFMSAIQVRYGGAKGVLTVNYQSDKKNTIQLRQSMIKYKITDEQDQFIIDILDRNKYRYGYLNRQVIILLKSLGISDQNFMDAQNTYINQLEKSALKDANIFTLFNNDYSKDGTRLQPITTLLRSMQTSRIDMDNDLFCKGIIHTLKKRGFYILRKKSNIFLEKSARLMGVIDEFNVLEQDEVFAYISQDQERTFFEVEGDVIVVKNPCLHPGDIRKLKAVTLETIQKRLGDDKFNPFKKLRNILIFPQKGKEPITSQIAGSDLDGDCYFICWDQRFIPEQQKEPFNYDQDANSVKKISQEQYEIEIAKKHKVEVQFTSRNPPKLTIEDNSEMLDFFIDFINNENLGKIDNSHLVFADKSSLFAEDPKCLQLASLHAQAVDYAKTGTSPKVPQGLSTKEYPDFMEKDDKSCYESQSILGKLYRDVKQQYEKHCKNDIEADKSLTFIETNLLFNPPAFINEIINEKDNKTYLETEIEFAIDANNQWNIEINNLKQFFGAQNEFEIYTGNFSKLIKVERKKKMSAEIVQQRILSTLLAIKNRFELMFFKDLDEDKERFYDETNRRKYFSKKCRIRASIWYTICYLRQREHVDKYINEFDQNSLLGQVFIILKQEKYYGQDFRGNTNRSKNGKIFFNQNNDFIGLAWFIISQIILEIKRDNDEFKMNEQKQNQNQKQKEEFIKYKYKFFGEDQKGYESDEYL